MHLTSSNSTTQRVHRNWPGAFIVGLLLSLTAFGQWSEPVPLGGPINDDLSIMKWPSINATDDVLYYTKLTGSQQEDIFYSTRLTDTTWSAPIPLPAIINTPQRELSPAIGPGDSVLYFVTWERPGGYGDYDIWFSRRRPNGQWGTPENAGPNVNTGAMEWGVFLSRDGRLLYFSSDHYPSEFLDIYKSVWQDSGGWGPAVRLPGHINSFSDDENITLPADEDYLILTLPCLAQSHVDLYSSNFNGAEWAEASRIPELSTNRPEEGASYTRRFNGLFRFGTDRQHAQQHSPVCFASAKPDRFARFQPSTDGTIHCFSQSRLNRSAPEHRTSGINE